MRFFFRSRQFKIILTVAAGILALCIITGVVGGAIAPHSSVLGTVTAPFVSLAQEISDGVKGIVNTYKSGNELMFKNDELETEINELREKLGEYDKAMRENEFYKDYLGIKDENPDFEFTPATLISRDNEDPFKGFVINKGVLNGISEHDPVITDAGVVGYVSEVGLTTSKVATILSTELTLGAIDNRTNDSGIVSGNMELALKNECKMYNLSRSCTVAVGDYVVTSGEGIFPDDLLIGTITYIGSDEYSSSIYANVSPFVDMSNIKNVMVITDFEGQGGVIPQGDE